MLRHHHLKFTLLLNPLTGMLTAHSSRFHNFGLPRSTHRSRCEGHSGGLRIHFAGRTFFIILHD